MQILRIQLTIGFLKEANREKEQVEDGDELSDKLPIVASLLRRPSFRIPIVLTVMLAWAALFNHCALGAVEHGHAQPAMTCHGSPGDKHAPPEGHGEVECCKVIRATLLNPEKIAPPLNDLFVAPCNYFVALLILQDTEAPGGLLEWDTGPPHALSFSESVLQRSILAHAPPFSLS
jgi:hypothetical protein